MHNFRSETKEYYMQQQSKKIELISAPITWVQIILNFAMNLKNYISGKEQLSR